VGMGFFDNVSKVATEFVQSRKLKPLKLYVNGPPGAGKSHFSEKLSAFLNLPHILIKDIYDDVITLKDEFGQKLQKRLAFLKIKMIEDYKED